MWTIPFPEVKQVCLGPTPLSRKKLVVIETSMISQNQHVLGIGTAKSLVRWRSAALLKASLGVSQWCKICTKCIRTLCSINSLEKVAILLTEKLVVMLL